MLVAVIFLPVEPVPHFAKTGVVELKMTGGVSALNIMFVQPISL